ncbi:MAG: trypsin-like peptidase domain-containing protein [Thermoguttaceae bacterium]|nr:trypsin-like peptidase domain-containing protein [Thermoguttaceae bacterium]
MVRIESIRTLARRFFVAIGVLSFVASGAFVSAQTTTQAQAPMPTPTQSQSSASKAPSVPARNQGVNRGSERVVVSPPANVATRRSKSEHDELLAKNSSGVQTRYPAIVKVVSHCSLKEDEKGEQKAPMYYGTGVFVAEYENWGIVLTNWHVVSEADVSIEVRFPSGDDQARVLLCDMKWDIAALLIKKPQGVSPMPLSLAAPKVGETLWTAGYGPSNGLTDFQIQSGVMTNYVSLDIPVEDLPEEAREQYLQKQGGNGELKRDPLYETASIKVGVRQGDSGGPVLNRYGEVAGLLWGSDGEYTMSTSSVRLQTFVTQSVRFAARLRANKTLDSRATGESIDDLLPWVPTQVYPEAFLTDLPMTDAVRYEGVFPSSTTPLYVPGNGVDSARALFDLEQKAAIKHVQIVANDYWRTRPNGLPPSPPIFSPTFVVQQRQVKRERPELINEKTFDKLNSATMASVERERRFISSEKLIAGDVPTMRAQLKRSSMISEPKALASSGARSIFAEGAAEPDPEPGADVGPERSSAQPKASGSSEGVVATVPARKFTKLQAYGIICALFSLFYFSVRSMRPGAEK